LNGAGQRTKGKTAFPAEGPNQKTAQKTREKGIVMSCPTANYTGNGISYNADKNTGKTGSFSGQW